MFERLFKLRAHGSNPKREMVAGLTTFMTMAYILAVNPQILGAAGMPAGGVLIATAISAAIACFIMAFAANLPFALAPGMGLNAYFAYTVVLTMGYSWQTALFAVFVEGLIFIVLSLTHVREAIFNAIPQSIKFAVSAGIGLFIAFIGLKGAGVIIANQSTFIGLNSFREHMRDSGLTAILCLLGVLLIAILAHYKVRGAVLFGILATWIVGMLCQLVGLYVPNPEAGYFSLYPNFAWPAFGEFSSIVGQAFNFSAMNFQSILGFATVLFAFLFVDLFDTLGTLIGVASRADMLDEKGQLPRIKGALLADAIGTSTGAVLGTSTVTTFVESSAGVAVGGRTGLTALTTGALFLLAIICSPIFIAIPAFATGAALVYIGFLMFGQLLKIKFDDMTEGLPAYLCALGMPFFYSIAEGIAFGVISYVLLNLFTGRFKTKRISILMYVLAGLFLLKYFLL